MSRFTLTKDFNPTCLITNTWKRRETREHFRSGVWLLLVLLAFVALPHSANGQGEPPSTFPKNPLSLDRLKPEDFETIDIFTGQLRLNFMLHAVNGRGSVGGPIMLRSKGRWVPYVQEEQTDWNPDVLLPYLHHGWADEELVEHSPTLTTTKYVGGMMYARMETIPTGSIVGAFPYQGGCGACSTSPSAPPASRFKNGVTLTTLSYTAPDGSIYQFRDALTGGKPLQPLGTCGFAGPSRGFIFNSIDGSGATFVSDTEIRDPGFHTGLNSYFEQGYTWTEIQQLPGYPALNGYVQFRDGTVARIENWRTVWLRDRNGNKTTFHYDPNILSAGDTALGAIAPFGRVVKIVDSLGREVDIAYQQNDATYGLHDKITFKGFGGQTKEIRVVHKPLEQALRADQSLQNLEYIYSVFGNGNSQLWWQQASTIFNPTVAAEIWLPNGRKHKILYNSFAEPARIELATGGAVEYEHENGTILGDMEKSGHKSSPFIYRRLTEKRVYANGETGTFWTSKTTISQTTGFNSGKDQYVDTTIFDKNSSGVEFVSSRQRHYFHGQAGHSYVSKTMNFPAWNLARKFKTESIDPSTGAVLRRDETVWQQGSTVSWWYNTPIVYSHWVAGAGHVSYLEPLGAPTTHCGQSWSGSGTYNPLWNAQPDDEPAFNVRVSEMRTTIEPASANLVTKQTFSYDAFNNVTDVYEYDFGVGAAGALIRRTHTDYVTSSSYTNSFPGPHIRNLPSQRWISSDAAGTTKVSFTAFEYDNYANDARHKPLVSRSGITGHDGAYSTSWTTRGNVTTTTSYANAASQTGPVLASAQYDIAGNVVATVDGLGSTSTITYSDSFCNGTSCGGTFTPNTFAFATSSTSPIPDPTGQNGSPTALVTSRVFDFWTGLTTASTDAANQTTSFQFNDSLHRLTAVIRPDGSRTDIEYGDTPGNLFTRTLTDLDTTRKLDAYEYFDGLGRATEKREYEGGSNYIAIKQEYDGLGRLRRISNPYRPWQSETAVWTTTAYDSLGRVVSMTTPDNSVATTTYIGNQATLTDPIQPTGRKRKTVTDALGRLKEVYEDPNGLNYLTSYQYDALGNLRTVTQGTQTRTFVYDSLSRMTSATNPESGTINYQYDANGNLLVKTDARNVSTHFAYDGLDREVRKWYNTSTATAYNVSTNSNNVPALPGTVAPTDEVIYKYDSGTNGKGHLWRTIKGIYTNELLNRDALGRPQLQRQFVGAPYSDVTYEYNLGGKVKKQVYPSTRYVEYSYDAAGRVSEFRGTLGDGALRTYATGIQYSTFGGITRQQFGTQTPLYHKNSYNNRAQLQEVRLSSVDDSSWNRGKLVNFYGTTDNNGHLKWQEHHSPAGNVYRTTFEYDSLNRLQSARETLAAVETWKQTYLYDRWGNRNIDVANTTSNINRTSYAINSSTNRLGVPGGSGGEILFDAAGNLTKDTYTASGTFLSTYDAENRLTQRCPTSGCVTYVGAFYDGDGRRRQVIGPTYSAEFVYGLDDTLLAENSNGKEYGYLNGQLLIVATGVGSDVRWLVSDHLGTARIVTDKTGNASSITRHDYLPFGEEIASSIGGRATQGYSSDGVRQQFTSKERDESGLDYFVARYHSSIQGRFTGVDPALDSFDSTNPQSLNRYTYCLNQPLSYVDPDGEVPLLGNLIAAGTSIATGYIIAKMTGQEYGLAEAALDGVTGFAGVGVLNKGRQLYRIMKLRSMANKMGMVRQGTQKTVERYVGSNHLRLDIKWKGQDFWNPNGKMNFETSMIPRAEFRISAGVYQNPFTGAVGPLRSTAAHTPLYLLPFSEAPVAGAGIGALRGVLTWADSTSGGGGGYSQANGAFYNLRVIGLGAARIPTINVGNLGTVDVYPDGTKRYRGPLKPRGPGFD